MKRILLLSLILLVNFSYVKSQNNSKYKITATFSPLLFYNFSGSNTSEHFNNYNYSFGLLGTYYFGRKSKGTRFSINSGLLYKTKKFNSYYLKHDMGILSLSVNDYKYIGIPILLGLDFKILNDNSISLLSGITLNKIVSTSYQIIRENGTSEETDPGLSYTGLHEFYTQLSFCKSYMNRKLAVSLGPFMSYKYQDSIEFSDSYFHLGRFSYGVAIGFSF